MASARHTLLIVDDDQQAISAIKNYLSETDFELYLPDSVEQAERLIIDSGLDLFICNPVSFNNTAHELIKKALQTEFRTPTIVITENEAVNEAVSALRLGVSDYLIKPLSDKHLFDSAITRCLEFARLRRENKNYREQLEKTNKELTNSLTLLQQDQQAGKHVQTKMLPPTPFSRRGYVFEHSIIPSLMLSGDFTDYFTLSSTHIVFYIADVSGHGASSAFVTVLLKNMFARKRNSYLDGENDIVVNPEKMLAAINHALLETSIGKHVTLCMGVIEIESNTLTYSNAGHLPLPALYVDGIAEYLECEGMPIGLIESANFHQKSIKLPDKFVLTLFSDGILEVLPQKGLTAKESGLLDRLQQGISSMPQLKEALGIDKLENAPDDIAVLTVSRQ